MLHPATRDPESMSRTELIARVDQLEATLEAMREANQPAVEMALQTAFGLSNSECKFLMLLADGKPRRKDQLHSGLYSDRIDDPPEVKIIDVFVCKVRKKVDRYGLVIETIWGSGYRLNDAGGVLAKVAAGEKPEKVQPPRERRGNPPHLEKRKGYTDFKSLLAELHRRADGRGVCRFTAREIAAAASVRRPISVLVDWLRVRNEIEIVQRAPHGRTGGGWVVRVLRRQKVAA